jgi:hypothetical protein
MSLSISIVFSVNCLIETTPSLTVVKTSFVKIVLGEGRVAFDSDAEYSDPDVIVVWNAVRIG